MLDIYKKNVMYNSWNIINQYLCTKKLYMQETELDSSESLSNWLDRFVPWWQRRSRSRSSNGLRFGQNTNKHAEHGYEQETQRSIQNGTMLRNLLALPLILVHSLLLFMAVKFFTSRLHNERSVRSIPRMRRTLRFLDKLQLFHTNVVPIYPIHRIQRLIHTNSTREYKITSPIT